MPSWINPSTQVKKLPRPLRQAGRRWQVRARQVQAASRQLPSMIIIGAMKGGTSTLHWYLASHSMFVPGLVKEIHFFDNDEHYSYGLPWYQAHFPKTADIRASSVTYESSPRYLFDPRVPHRIKRTLGNPKMIAILRNPTERALSHYRHEVRAGRETLSFEQALAAEEQRLERPLAAGDVEDEALIHHSYKARGRYIEQLERYLDVFAPEQLLILSIDDLSRPQDCVTRIAGFVGVDDERVELVDQRWNSAATTTIVPDDARRQLDDYFAPYNAALHERLGLWFPWPGIPPR